MDYLDLKCLKHPKMNVCLINKNLKEQKSSLLLCHKCLLERQDSLSKYSDLYDVLENSFKNQDQLIELNFQVLFERVIQRKQGIITMFQKKVDEIQKLVQTLISKYNSLEQEIYKSKFRQLKYCKIIVILKRNELKEFKEQLRIRDWDSKEKHEQFQKVFFKISHNGQLEYQKLMTQYFELINDRQLTNEIGIQIQEIFFKQSELLQSYKDNNYEGTQTCQMIKDVRKPNYENYQIINILYQNTQSEQLYQLLQQPIRRIFLFFKNTLKISISRDQNKMIDIKRYSKNGKEKFSQKISAIIKEKNKLQIYYYYTNVYQQFKSLKKVFVDSKPVSVEKLIILDEIKFNDIFQKTIINQDEFLLQI